MRQMTSREFNHDIGKAKRAADEGPLLVTDRGRPAYVLIKYEHYRGSAASGASMFDLLDDKAAGDFEFDPPRLQEIGPRLFELD